MTQDVNVFLVDFPGPEKEMTVENEDGSYSIFLNAKLSYEEQLHAYEHATRHIENNDFEKADVQKIEAAAHNLMQDNIRQIPKDQYEKHLRRAKRERRKLQKQQQEYEEAMQELRPMIDSVAEAENFYLYGKDY